jgi:hypothetical protein
MINFAVDEGIAFSGGSGFDNAAELRSADLAIYHASPAINYAQFRVWLGGISAPIASIPASIRTRLYADACTSSWSMACNAFLMELQPLFQAQFPDEDVGAHLLLLQR